MYLVQHFVKNYGKIDQITELMDNLEMILVPFVNPDGYVVGVAGPNQATPLPMMMNDDDSDGDSFLAVHLGWGPDVEEKP